MVWKSFGRENCSLEATASIIGDRQTLLVLRECFLRVRRFGELQRNTGLARNILADRLQALVGNGILERREYQDRPQRFEYRLTQKGLDLYPILLGLMEWGAKYETGKDGTLVALRHRSCGAVGQPHLSCPGCGERVTARDMEALPGLGAVLKTA
ncbi:MAG: helix-turn-helix transcriptional regulator [Gaiellaceae bacterium MAG52_C11]|nr:helix-turn-helix transcriptional regulator [Candidatus Gaiellasilicea maunaloa]